MSNTLRKIKRNTIKKELGNNNISKEFHKRYGYRPNLTKEQFKILKRFKKRIKKLIRLKVRLKKRGTAHE